MKITKIGVAMIIFGVLIGLGLNLLLPYNNAEKNMATVYYQSYSDFYMEYRKYVSELSIADDSEHTVEAASISRLESALNSIKIFRIAQQTSFRDTVLFERVLKEEIWEENLADLIWVLQASKDLIESNEVSNRKELILASGDLLEVIEPETLGYNSETKVYEVSLKEGSAEKITSTIERLADILLVSRS